MLTDLPAIGGIGGGEEPEPPRVVARSPSGEEAVVLGTGTLRQATRAVARFEAERRQIGDREFCVRYGLPLRLVTE